MTLSLSTALQSSSPQRWGSSLSIVEHLLAFGRGDATELQPHGAMEG
jgi:hypothetical protein